MIKKTLEFISHLFCFHKHTILKLRPGGMYVECIRCGWTSFGIVNGRHTYSKETYRRIERSSHPVKFMSPETLTTIRKFQ